MHRTRRQQCVSACWLRAFLERDTKKVVDGKAKACGAEVETGDCGWGVPGMPAEISFRTSGGGGWASGRKAQIYCCQGFQLSLAENAL